MAEGVAARPLDATNSSNHSNTTTTLLLPTLPCSHYKVDWLADWSSTAAAASTLAGYQLWAVEQRVTDRSAILPVIIVFTGDNNDTISVQRFTPPSSLSVAQQTRVFEATKTVLRSSGAKLSEARNGGGSYIPLTSLPSLDPNLSIVQLPGGDYEAVMPLLFANINLRRLGLGGRSGLRLTPATPAQQLHFRQSFRLPIPSPSSLSHSTTTSFNPPSASTYTLTVPTFSPAGHNHNHHSPPSPSPTPTPFTETILTLIRLVQHALSLYGLGIVQTPLPSSQTATPPLTHSTSEEYLEATASHLPPGRHLLQGDGLLCDTTLSALSLFRFEIAEPLVHLIKGEETVLSPSLLAALLSVAVGARGKMKALGEDVPKDVFERRNKFGAAVQAFAKHHRLPPTPYLTRPFLTTLSSLYIRTHNPTSSRTKVSRALRTRLDAGLSSLVPDGSAGVTSPLRRSKGEEVETSSLEGLVGEMERGVGGASLGRLWGMGEEKEGRRERRRASRERRRRGSRERGRGRGKGKDGEEKTDGEGTEGEKDRVGGGGTASEGESLAPSAHAQAHGTAGVAGEGVLSVGRGVLKGVKERAGRAGRMFGDGLGFTEATNPPAPTFTASSTTKLAPALVISPDPADSRSSTLEPESATTTSSKAAAFASRLASALSSEPHPSSSSSNPASRNASTNRLDVATLERQNQNLALTLSPSPSISPTMKSSSLSTSTGGGGGTGSTSQERAVATWANAGARMPSPRRSVSEAPGLPTMSSLGSEGETELDEEEAGEGEGEGEDRVGLGMRDGRGGAGEGREEMRTKRRRRHSFNVVRDAPEPWQTLSRKRLVLDVNLRMTYFTLHQKERKLAEMVEALKTVNTSYDQALTSLEPLLTSKTSQLTTLTTTALALSTHAESYSTTSSPLSKLSIGSSRLLYAQSVVEEKLGDVTDFSKLVKSKVGEGGTLEKGTKELGRERLGVRKLVKSVERWRVWLGFLGRRGVWHLGFGPKEEEEQDSG